MYCLSKLLILGPSRTNMRIWTQPAKEPCIFFPELQIQCWVYKGVHISGFVMKVMFWGCCFFFFLNKEAFNQVVQVHIYLRHAHCPHHHNTWTLWNCFFAPLTPTICGKIMWVALAWEAGKDTHRNKSIYSKMHFAAYKSKLLSSFC